MMSDQGKFINTYIDVMVGTIHEMMNSTLQLKTQMKVSADLLAEKDKQISSFVAEKEEIVKRYEAIIASNSNDKTSFDATIQSNQNEINNLKSQLIKAQQELDPLRNKASHTDSLLQQIVAMKQEIKNRDAIIAEKDNQLLEKDKEITNLIAKESEQKVKKSKSMKAEDVLKPQQINTKEDNLLKYKDDF